jgi:M6 family metalloprotease-like protein
MGHGHRRQRGGSDLFARSIGAALAVATAGCGPGEPHDAPWIGERRAAILLLAWADAPPTAPPAVFEEAFLDPVGPSLARYLDENSAGGCVLTGEVLGWRTAPERWADVDPEDPGEIAAIALRTFGSELDPAAFDADGNGRIDHLFVVHAGRTPYDRPNPSDVFARGEADATAVLQSLGVGSVGEKPGIGLYVHEAGHRFFRLRDLYGDYEHGHYGIGIWGVMGLGQWGPHNRIALEDLFRYPVHFRAAAKARIGWIEPTEITATTRGIRLDPIETSGRAVVIPTGGDQDLWLEVRGPHGFHADLPGHGLLLWREHWRAPEASTRAVLVAADGRDDLSHGTDLGARPLPPNDENWGDASDPFPGAEGVTTWADPALGVRLENIRHDGEAVVFDVLLAP